MPDIGPPALLHHCPGDDWLCPYGRVYRRETLLVIVPYKAELTTDSHVARPPYWETDSSNEGGDGTPTRFTATATQRCPGGTSVGLVKH